MKTRTCASGLALALFVCAARAGTPGAVASPAAELERLDGQLHEELALDGFASRRARGVTNGASYDRAGPWLLYGRVGPLRFRSDLEAPAQGLRFNLGGGSSGGPALAGRLNIGIYRRFH